VLTGFLFPPMHYADGARQREIRLKLSMLSVHTFPMPKATMRRRRHIPNERLKMYREAAGLSQEQLGSMIGRHQSIIARMESGEIPTTAGMAATLAPHLGVEPQELFPGAPGSRRAADGGGIDPSIIARANVVARRLAAAVRRDDEPDDDNEVLASEILALFYELLARERDGQKISDNEATLSLLEHFARRVRRLSEPSS
jgi:transcriptional regulator with XRE-family HTH domain